MSSDAQEIFDQLCEPFPVEAVSWRVGPTNKNGRKEGQPLKGQPLCYVDSRAVMDRLDAVCGPSGWQSNYTPGMQGSIVCNIGVRLDGEWLWKADGAGATDMEADKGALSDAFKRAAVRWGVGRYLYEMHHPWIELNDRGGISDEAQGKLDHFYEVHAPKTQWGVRGGIQAYRLLLNGMKTFVHQASDASEFEEKNKGLIAGLPVAMRKHFMEQLAKVGAPIREAAE